MKAFCTSIVSIVVANALLAALFVGCIVLPDRAGRRLATTCCFVGLQLYVWIGTASGTSLWRCGEGEKYKDCVGWGVVVNLDWLTALSDGGGVGNPSFIFLTGSIISFLSTISIWCSFYFSLISSLISYSSISCFRIVIILYKLIGIIFSTALGVYLMALFI